MPVSACDLPTSQELAQRGDPGVTTSPVADTPDTPDASSGICRGQVLQSTSAFPEDDHETPKTRPQAQRARSRLHPTEASLNALQEVLLRFSGDLLEKYILGRWAAPDRHRQRPLEIPRSPTVIGERKDCGTEVAPMAESVRVLVEVGNVMYLVGTIKPAGRTLALRRLGDRHADELGAFSSVRAARQACLELSQAKVVRFAGGDGVASHPIRGRRTRRRRRMLRRPAHPASMSAAPPLAPPGPSGEPSPSLPSHEAPRRTFVRDRRPTPETMVALNAALDRLETRTS